MHLPANCALLSVGSSKFDWGQVQSLDDRRYSPVRLPEKPNADRAVVLLLWLMLRELLVQCR